MRKKQPLKIRHGIPSKGKRRFRRRRVRDPVAGAISGYNGTATTTSAINALKKKGWTFEFITKVISPRGFTYQGIGPSSRQSFLKAFGQGQSDCSGVFAKSQTPATPPAASKPAPPIKISPATSKRTYEKTYINELLALCPEVAALRPLGPRVPPSSSPRVNRYRAWGRLYMRAYRSGRVRKRKTIPLALAA